MVGRRGIFLEQLRKKIGQIFAMQPNYGRFRHNKLQRRQGPSKSGTSERSSKLQAKKVEKTRHLGVEQPVYGTSEQSNLQLEVLLSQLCSVLLSWGSIMGPKHP